MTVGVHRIGIGGSSCYLVEGSEGAILVDTGFRGRERKIVERLRRLAGKRLLLVFITHAHLDHYGNASAIRRLTGAPVGIHRADAEAMARGETPLGDVRGWGKGMKRLMPLVEPFVRPEPVEADILFEDGAHLDSLGFEAEVIHTPGHTPGSSALVVEGRIAFVGDLVSTRGWPHAQLFYATDWSAVGRSLRRLQALDLEAVYTGHGVRPVRGDVFRRIAPPKA